MAAAVSENIAEAASPISQSVDAFNSPKVVPGESSSSSFESDSPDLSFPALTSSPSKQLDSLGQISSRVEEYRQLFRLPADEALIQDFNCALQENFLLQGHMYLFVHYICFYSNLFGFETKRIIPFEEITSVRRAKAVAVFPTAIEVVAGEKKYFFTSFLFRDEAFRLINDYWQRNNDGSIKVVDKLVPNDSKPDKSFQDSDGALYDGLNTPRETVDDLDISQSNKSGPLIEECSASGVGDFEIVPSSVSEAREGVDEEVMCSSSKSSLWAPEDTDALGVPEGYTKVAESKFPIRAEEFFNLFFSDDGINFQAAFHAKCGDKDFKSSLWRPYERSGHSRDTSFQHPIKLYFGARYGSCQEIQKFRVYRNCHLVIDTSQDINDVPYGNYFKVEGRWDIEEVNDKSKPWCKLKVYTNVAFSKKTMWKAKIVQSTVEECKEAYAIWIELAHELLKQKSLEPEGAPKPLVQLNKREYTEEYMELTSTGNRTSSNTPALMQTGNGTNALLPNNSDQTSTASWSRSVFVRFSSSFRRQNNLSLLLVIAVALTFFLMQISIVVLLSRPQRIQVIHQTEAASSIPGLSLSRSDAIKAVTKQMKHLREEMHFVETMLERMQQEHAQLKESLKKLELFRNH